MPEEWMEFIRQSIASHDRQIGELWEWLEKESQEIAALRNLMAQQTANVNKLVEVSNQDAISIRQLAAIAQRHEERLDNGGL
jgi:hypothetical protein